MILLFIATFDDGIEAFGETVAMFQFCVTKRSISNILNKVMQSTVQSVVFFLSATLAVRFQINMLGVASPFYIVFGDEFAFSDVAMDTSDSGR